MTEEGGKEITVQGSGDLVPAAFGSEQAGSRSSISCDRSGIQEVDPLASMSSNSTRKSCCINGPEKDLFGRSGNVHRLPANTNAVGLVKERVRSFSVGTKPNASNLAAMVLTEQPTQLLQARANTQSREEATPTVSANTPNQQKPTNSPRLELIYKMRTLEEESVAKCKTILRKMKHAIQRQKNVNMDVKDGISELAEQLDVIERYRKSWKSAENERTEQIQKATSESVTTSSIETPITRSKRTASSPAEETPSIGKKKKEDERQQWQTVKRRNEEKPANNKKVGAQETAKENSKQEKRQRPKRKKTEAVLIQPAEGRSYAEVLKSLRSQTKIIEQTNVRGIRKTRNGGLLLELSTGEKLQPGFVQHIKETVQQAASITELKPKATVEIRDLDSLTEDKEVEEAIKSAIESTTEDVRIQLTPPNSREQVRAFVTLSTESAEKLLKLAKIKIGWIRARIRLRQTTKKCFRCFGVGHLQSSCQGPDRSKLCVKCGETGHKIKECTREARCCICADSGRHPVDHLPGSRGCPASKLSQA